MLGEVLEREYKLWQPSCQNCREEERENMNCGNQVAENGRKKIVAMALSKWRGKKFVAMAFPKQRGKKLWQLICGNGIVEIEGKKKCRNVVAEMKGKEKEKEKLWQ